MSSIQKNKKLIERPPVVVIMGHIDHGKSTLLDFIRKSNVVKNEAGSITQHLGAYEVEHKRNGEAKKITFIDTPGHEAFKSVRSRGAEVADVAVLIVSAEDGVMPQTLEALEAIKKSKIPFVVAINKIDTPRANIEKTKNDLIENEIYLEGFGGDVPYAEISALNGKNVDDLLDIILLSAEIEEHKGNPDACAEGFVVESHKDKFTGITTTLVIKNGSLKQGQFVASCDAYSPIRLMKDHSGKQIRRATFSTPISVSGWNKIPRVGFEFTSFDSKKEAEKYCGDFDEEKRTHTAKEKKISDSYGKVRKAEDFLVPIIIKADTDGSLEAILYELNKVEIANEGNNAQTKIISAGTGNISENDLKFANCNANTVIVGFGVDIDKQAEIMAERTGIKTKTFDIIYELTDWLTRTIEENRPRMEIEERRGLAKVLRVFNKARNQQILGGRVIEGVVATGNKFRVLRRGEEIGTGIIKGMQQQKSEASEVSEGTEFGTSIDSKVEISAGDEIEVYEIIKK